MIIPDKLDLLDHSFTAAAITSFAELGCTWGVDGAYGFHVLERYPVTHAVQVDSVISDAMKARAAAHPQLRQLARNFGEPDVPEAIGDVDAVILFDVLLHQVRPDWDEVLRMYAPRTRHFLVYNQQWVKGPDTVRLVDLGKEEYFRSVPAGSENLRSYLGLFEGLGQPAANQPGRTRRDGIGIWQWGITDSDLLKALARLGFELRHYRNHGSAFDIASFENHSFLFSRR